MAQVAIGGIICEMDATAQEQFEKVARWLKQVIEERNAALVEADALRLMHAAIENDAENRIRAHDAVNEARAENAKLRTALTEVLAILKSGRSTGRTAIKALYAAEDVVMVALEPDTSSGDEIDEKYLTTFGGDLDDK